MPPLDYTAVELQVLMGFLGKTMRVEMEQALQAQGITISAMQMGILRVLHNGGTPQAQSVSDISKKLVLDPSTLIPAIDSLERKGYATRQRDTQDRRRVHLYLTEAGENLLLRAAQMSYANAIHRAIVSLGEADSAAFLALLRRLVAAVPGGDEALQHAHEACAFIITQRPPDSP